jgi:hypothetical protein
MFAVLTNRCLEQVVNIMFYPCTNKQLAGRGKKKEPTRSFSPFMMLGRRRNTPSLDRFTTGAEHVGRKARADEDWKSEGPKTEKALSVPVKTRNGEGLYDCRRPGAWSAKTICRHPRAIETTGPCKTALRRLVPLVSHYMAELVVCPSMGVLNHAVMTRDNPWEGNISGIT